MRLEDAVQAMRSALECCSGEADVLAHHAQELVDAIHFGQSHRAAEPRYTREQVEQIVRSMMGDSELVWDVMQRALRTLDGEGAPDES